MPTERVSSTIFSSNDPLPESSAVTIGCSAGCSVLDASLESVGRLDILLDQAVLVRSDWLSTKYSTDEVQPHFQGGTKLIRSFACLCMLYSTVRVGGANVISVCLGLGRCDALPVAYSMTTLLSFHNY